MQFYFLYLCGFILFGVGGALADASPLAQARLSADGQWVAGRAAPGGPRLCIVHVPRREGGSQTDGDGQTYDVDAAWFAWIGGSRLLVAARDGQLMTIDPTTSTQTPLLKDAGPRPKSLPPVLLSPVREDRDSVLLQWEDPSAPGFPAVYRVTVSKRQAEKVTSAFSPIVRWLASPDGRISGGVAYDGTQKLVFGPDSEQGWREIYRVDQLVDPGFRISAVEPLGALSFVLTSGSDPNAPERLFSLSMITGSVRPIGAWRKGAVQRVITDPISGLVRGWDYLDSAGSLRTHSLDQDRARPLLADDRAVLADASVDGLRLLYQKRGAFAEWQIREALSGRIDVRLSAVPDLVGRVARLDRADGSSMRFMVLGPADKGLDVLYIHGGPHGASQAPQDPFVRALVAAGAQVYVPDFLGTAKTSAAYQRAGFGEWGGAMQRDIDLMAVFIRQNRAPGRRLLVAGASYGGFSALLALADHPGWFDGGITLNPVVDMEDWIAAQSARRLGPLFRAQILGVGQNIDRLVARSPLVRAGRIQAPLLLVAGALDQTVPKRHADRLAQRMVRASIDGSLRFRIIPSMGHAWPSGEAKATLDAEISGFLKPFLLSEADDD